MELLGKSWTYKLEIVQATGLPVIADMTYCQYEFFGQTYTTDTVRRGNLIANVSSLAPTHAGNDVSGCQFAQVEIETSSPQLQYEYIHHIDVVTQEFLDFLDKPLEIQLYISPTVAAPKDTISTTNEIVKLNITTGKPHRAVQSANGTAAIAATPDGQEATIASLQRRVQELEEENQKLKARIAELETAQVSASANGSVPGEHERPISRQRIESAIKADKELNSS